MLYLRPWGAGSVCSIPPPEGSRHLVTEKLHLQSSSHFCIFPLTAWASAPGTWDLFDKPRYLSLNWQE